MHKWLSVDCSVRHTSLAKVIKRRRHCLKILRWGNILYFLFYQLTKSSWRLDLFCFSERHSDFLALMYFSSHHHTYCCKLNYSRYIFLYQASQSQLGVHASLKKCASPRRAFSYFKQVKLQLLLVINVCELTHVCMETLFVLIS